MRRGYSVSEYGVKVVETGEVLTHADETALYELLGYQLIPPELRENLGELEAAREGTLPELVELRDLKGDLHAHTTWSADGKASAEEMALAAKERGYRYLAVTDHSHYLREGRHGGAGPGARRAERAARAVPAAQGRRGEHQGRRDDRRPTTRASRRASG